MAVKSRGLRIARYFPLILAALFGKRVFVGHGTFRPRDLLPRPAANKDVDPQEVDETSIKSKRYTELASEHELREWLSQQIDVLGDVLGYKDKTEEILEFLPEGTTPMALFMLTVDELESKMPTVVKARKRLLALGLHDLIHGSGEAAQIPQASAQATGWIRRLWIAPFSRTKSLLRQLRSLLRFTQAAKTHEEHFNALFRDLKPAGLYLNRPMRDEYIEQLDSNKALSIMNGPKDRLTLPLIGFNSSYWAAVATSLMRRRPDPRRKPVLATFRGIGGGKTRALEEIKYELLGTDCLPLSMTYNSDMEFRPRVEFSWSTSPDVNYALGVVSRLACNFYGMKLHLVQQRITKLCKSVAEPDASFEVSELIRAFVRHVVQKLRKDGRDVAGVIVLADEVKKVEDAFAKRYNLIGDSRDINGILRSALLNVEIADGVDVGLVMSTLSLTAVGETESGRTARGLILTRLIARDVLDKLWERKGQDELLPLAIAACDLPRIAECVGSLLKDIGDTPLNADMRTKLLQNVSEVLFEVYGTSLKGEVLTTEELQAIVFRQRVRLTARTYRLLRASLFTNVLRRFPDPEVENFTFIPEASLLLLALGETDNEKATKVLRQFLQNMLTKTEGGPLEWALDWWLRLRLAVMSGQRLSVGRLLGLDTMACGGQRVEMINQLFVNVQATAREIRLPDIRKDPEAAMKVVQETTMEENEILLLRPDKSDCFDLGLAARTAAGGTYIIAINCKSAGDSARSRRDADILSGQEDDFRKFARRFQGCFMPTQQHSLAEAFRKGRHAYIVLTSFGGKGVELPNAIILRKKETKQFFGPLWHFYRAIRARA